MKEVGLQPSNNGMVGGKETGAKMSDYIIPNGRFENAFAKLAAGGWRLNLQSAHSPGRQPGVRSSKTKFSCPECRQNVWGKPDTAVTCTHCGVPLRAASGRPPQEAASIKAYARQAA
jgi:ribosomal protein S27E